MTAYNVNVLLSWHVWAHHMLYDALKEPIINLSISNQIQNNISLCTSRCYINRNCFLTTARKIPSCNYHLTTFCCAKMSKLCFQIVSVAYLACKKLKQFTKQTKTRDWINNSDWGLLSDKIHIYYLQLTTKSKQIICVWDKMDKSNKERADWLAIIGISRV